MYGCDGVICPLGTYSDPGHATHSEGCKVCPEGQTTMYLGSSSCDEFTEEDILSMLFDVMGVLKSEGSNEMKKKQDVCTWDGITCDDAGEVISIRFPLGELDDSDFLRD